jgi:hypothetical protein
MSKKTVYHSDQEAETGWNRAIQFKLNQGDDEGAQEIADMGLDVWLESTGRRIENPTNRKEQTNMPRETQAEKIARLEAELDEANSRIEELEDERQDALSSVAASYGVEIFDPGDETEYDEEGEIDEEESDEGNGRD